MQANITTVTRPPPGRAGPPRFFAAEGSGGTSQRNRNVAVIAPTSCATLALEEVDRASSGRLAALTVGWCSLRVGDGRYGVVPSGSATGGCIPLRRSRQHRNAGSITSAASSV